MGASDPTASASITVGVDTLNDLGIMFVCPQCRVALPPVTAWPDHRVRCTGCDATYPIRAGVPCFVSTDSYVENFSFEWLQYRRTQLDQAAGGESERTFQAKTGLTPQDVSGKLVLDAGCGTGRFAEVVSRWGGRVVGVDLSRAVEAARENLAARSQVLICQADLFHLPFPERSFDVIYSIGVLHHTPDCENAFRQLVRYLAPGGKIIIWLYADDQGLWRKFCDAYRRVTVRMPPRLLHVLCHLAIPAYYLFKIPGFGRLLWTLMPMSTHPDSEWRVLDTFDWYSPRYQSKHTYPEVYRWFQTEGLTQIHLLPVPIAVSGVKAHGSIRAS